MLNSTPRIARSRKRHRIRCAENLSLSFISFFKLFHARVSQYRVPCVCYDVSIWFLPRCNFSLLCTVQTECLTRPVNSSPRVALFAWKGLASGSAIPVAGPSRWIVFKVNICVSIRFLCISLANGRIRRDGKNFWSNSSSCPRFSLRRLFR